MKKRVAKKSIVLLFTPALLFFFCQPALSMDLLGSLGKLDAYMSEFNPIAHWDHQVFFNKDLNHDYSPKVKALIAINQSVTCDKAFPVLLP